MAYELQQRQIDRQNLIAQALRDSGNIPNSRVTQNAGGFVTPISPFEAATKLFGAGAGMYTQHQADVGEDALSKQKDKDKQAAISGLMDNLAGPSQMAVPKDQTAAPIGTTTNFDPNSPDAGVPQPQQPSMPGAAPVEQNQRRAAMAALLQGQPSDQIVQSLQGAALKKFEPKPDYTLGEDQRRISGDTSAVIAQGAPKVYKPPVEDRALVKVVDKSNPLGYSTKERRDFVPGVDNEWVQPRAGDVPVDPSDMKVAVQWAVAHDLQAPNWIGRSPTRQAAFSHELTSYLTSIGDDANAAKVRGMQDKADQSSLTKVTTLADNIDRAKNLLDKNLTDMQSYYDKTPNFDSELGNKVLRAWQSGVTGDETLKPVLGFLQASEKEYAKLQVNSFGNAMSSDAANAAAHKVINENFTRGGMKAVIQAMREEGDNSKSTIHQQKGDITTRLSERHPHIGETPPASTPAAAPKNAADLPAKNAKGWVLHSDPAGNLAYVGPNNEVEEVK